MLRENPRILHISCHGLEVLESKESCLLLEKESSENAGEGILVGSKKIQNLMKTMPKLDLVFLAACHSEKIGEVFVNSGARHVICIQ